MSIKQELGKVSVTPKGQWVTNVTYAVLDIVAKDGCSYIAKKNVPSGTPLTNDAYWLEIAGPGPQGPVGPIGPQPQLVNSVNSDDIDKAPTAAVAKLLNGRIDNFNMQLEQTDDELQRLEIEKVDKVAGKVLSTNDYTNIDKQYVEQIPQKADQTFVDAQLASIVSGAPKGTFTDLQALQAAYPNGTTGVFLTLSNGHWYYWNETTSAWTDGGVYQGTTVNDGVITPNKTTFLKNSLNLLIIENYKLGVRINPDTGAEYADANYILTDYIPIESSTQYYLSGTHGWFEYNESKSYLRGTTNGTDIVRTSLVNGKYVRLAIRASHFKDFMLVKGNSAPSVNYIETGYETDILEGQLQAKEMFNTSYRTLESFEGKKYEHIINITNDATVSSSDRVALTYDYLTKFKNNYRSLRCMLLTSAATITYNLPTPLELVGVSEFVAQVYIEDIQKITNFVIKIPSTNFNRGTALPVSQLKNGWNTIRFQCAFGDISNWSTTNVVALDIYFNAMTTIYLSDIYVVKHQKAKILFIDDHGYHNFKVNAYPRLKALKIPVTWAINPGRLGAIISATESILTQTDIDELVFDHYSELSLHAWNPVAKSTATMTSEELIEDTYKCIAYIKKNGGYNIPFWRSAFVQNLAPAHAAIRYLVDAYASPSENASGGNLYPFVDKYNIGRASIHGRSDSWFDSTFDVLKKTRGVFVCYTHGLDDSGGIHITNAQFDYFLSKIQTGINEGWLEGTTYSKLKNLYGYSDYSEVF